MCDNTSCKRLAGVTGLMAVGVMTSFATAQAEFTGIGDLMGGSDASNAFGISADGTTVVGNSSSGSNEPCYWTAVGGIVGIGDLPGGNDAGICNAASANGSVVVGEGRSNIGTEGFLWNSGDGILGLGIISGGQFESIANDISDDGTLVVGGNTPGVEAFRWTSAGGMVLMGYLEGGTVQSSAWGVSGDGLVIVGHSRSTVATIFFGLGTAVEAFRWTSGGGMVGLSDMVSPVFPTGAFAASTDGSVIVGVGQNTTTLDTEAFRWTSGGTIGLGVLPGGLSRSWAYDVSGDGSIVVGDSNDGMPVAFIWDAGNGMRKLKDVLENDHGLDLTGWELMRATGISADGRTIVGTGFNPDGNGEGWIAALDGIPMGCTADADGSGDVGIDDFLAVLAEWGFPCEIAPCTADANGDGTIGIDDFLKILADWGPCS